MQIIFWLIALPLGIISFVTWIYRMPDRGAIPHSLKIAGSRMWGESHRFGRGKLWESDEHELYRVRLLGVTAYSVDRRVQLQRRTTCIVTSRRLMVCDDHGSRVQILAADIRTARANRAFDPAEGFSYSVVVDRVSSSLHDPEGDLCLHCASQSQSQELYSAISELHSTLVPV